MILKSNEHCSNLWKKEHTLWLLLTCRTYFRKKIKSVRKTKTSVFYSGELCCRPAYLDSITASIVVSRHPHHSFHYKSIRTYNKSWLMYCIRRRRADIRVQALASLPASLYILYNDYIYTLLLNFLHLSNTQNGSTPRSTDVQIQCDKNFIAKR